MTSFTFLILTILLRDWRRQKQPFEEAFRIRPNAGEAHLARAWHLYNGYLDYEGALAELEVARQTLPAGLCVGKIVAIISDAIVGRATRLPTGQPKWLPDELLLAH